MYFSGFLKDEGELSVGNANVSVTPDTWHYPSKHHLSSFVEICFGV